MLTPPPQHVTNELSHVTSKRKNNYIQDGWGVGGGFHNIQIKINIVIK